MSHQQNENNDVENDSDVSEQNIQVESSDDAATSDAQIDGNEGDVTRVQYDDAMDDSIVTSPVEDH